MNYANCADFFLAGLMVAWPAMLWSGHLEAGVILGAALLVALLCSGAMADDQDRSLT